MSIPTGELSGMAATDCIVDNVRSAEHGAETLEHRAFDLRIVLQPAQDERRGFKRRSVDQVRDLFR